MYFLINGTDFSKYVKNLKVNKSVNYNAQTNAAGNTVVDFVNSKRTIEVGFIPLTDTQMMELMLAIDAFSVSITYRNPKTNTLSANVNCIVPDNEVDYYTIQENKVMYNEFSLTFIEL